MRCMRLSVVFRRATDLIELCCINIVAVFSTSQAALRRSSMKARHTVVAGLLAFGLFGGANAAAAQYKGASSSACLVSVAFEHLFIRSDPSFHAVILLSGSGISETGFEANPSDGPSGSHPLYQGATLVARERNMVRSPLSPLYGGGPISAGSNGQACSVLLERMRGLVAQINAARLPYSPTPELLNRGAVNSNSFAYWAICEIGLPPPPPPRGGIPWGYNPAIVDN